VGCRDLTLRLKHPTRVEAKANGCAGPYRNDKCSLRMQQMDLVSQGSKVEVHSVGSSSLNLGLSKMELSSRKGGIVAKTTGLAYG
jgi:hypothetical protein